MIAPRNFIGGLFSNRINKALVNHIHQLSPSFSVEFPASAIVLRLERVPARDRFASC